MQTRRPCCSTVCGYPVGSDLYHQHVLACTLSTAARFLSAMLDLESAPTVLSCRQEVATLLETTLEAGTRGSDADVLQHRQWLLAQLTTALQSAHCSRLLCWMRIRVLKQTPSGKSPVRLAIHCRNLRPHRLLLQHAPSQRHVRPQRCRHPSSSNRSVSCSSWHVSTTRWGPQRPPFHWLRLCRRLRCGKPTCSTAPFTA